MIALNLNSSLKTSSCILHRLMFMFIMMAISSVPRLFSSLANVWQLKICLTCTNDALSSEASVELSITNLCVYFFAFWRNRVEYNIIIMNVVCLFIHHISKSLFVILISLMDLDLVWPLPFHTQVYSLLLDSRLIFNVRVRNILTKATQKTDVFLCRFASCHLSHIRKKHSFISYILPALEFSSNIWNPTKNA